MKRRDFIIKSSFLFTLPVLFKLNSCKHNKKGEKYQNPEIRKLNLAIEHEYGAIVQYSHHAGITKNKKFKHIIHHIISQEVSHAISMAEIVKRLGYKPTLNIWPPQDAKNFKEILKEDILVEKNAIELYESILKLKELNKNDKKIIEKIIKHEENHLKIFKNFIHQK